MKWTPDIIARVRRDAATHTRDQMARALGINVMAIDSAIQRYGFHFKRAERPLPATHVVSDPESGLSVELRAEIEAARAEARDAPLYRRPTLF